MRVLENEKIRVGSGPTSLSKGDRSKNWIVYSILSALKKEVGKERPNPSSRTPLRCNYFLLKEEEEKGSSLFSYCSESSLSSLSILDRSLGA